MIWYSVYAFLLVDAKHTEDLSKAESTLASFIKELKAHPPVQATSIVSVVRGQRCLLWSRVKMPRENAEDLLYVLAKKETDIQIGTKLPIQIGFNLDDP